MLMQRKDFILRIYSSDSCKSIISVLINHICGWHEHNGEFSFWLADFKTDIHLLYNFLALLHSHNIELNEKILQLLMLPNKRATKYKWFTWHEMYLHYWHVMTMDSTTSNFHTLDIKSVANLQETKEYIRKYLWQNIFLHKKLLVFI